MCTSVSMATGEAAESLRLVCSGIRIFHGKEIQDFIKSEVKKIFFKYMGYTFLKNKIGYYSVDFSAVSEARREGNILRGLRFWLLNGFS